jgi:HAD superfamily hydrolase (TIGR01509 family)
VNQEAPTVGPLQAEAFGFDFDHTLGIDNHLERTVALELLNGENPRGVDVALAAYRYGARSIDDAVAAIGIDPERFRSLVLERAPRFVEPMPGAEELLSGLRAQALPVAILSNGWHPLQEHKARIIGFQGPVLVSDEIGARKPSFAAFLRLQHVLGIAAPGIVYVGDDPVPDMCGALSAGMQAIWLDGEGRSYPQDVAAPSASVRALTDILSLVQGPLGRAAKPLA